MFFDQFTEQNEGLSDNLPNPRCLIEIGAGEWVQSLGNVQMGEVPVTLHIGIDIFNTFNNKSDYEKNLAYMGLLDTIFIKLNEITTYDIPEALQTDNLQVSNFHRIEDAFATNPGNIKVSTITFLATVADYRTDKNPVITESDVDAIDTQINY